MLVPRITLGDLDLTDAPFAIEFGRDIGAPQNVVDDVVTMLTDGELITSSRSSNRTLVLPLLIEGADMVELADAEALLIAEADKQQNELTIDPGDDFGPPTVYDTFRAQVEFAYDDDGEVAGLRRYVLTIPALPFGRSPIPVTTTAVSSAATPSTVTVNDGSSATGWSSSDGTVPTSDGAVVSLAMAYEAMPGFSRSWQTKERWLRLSGSFDFSSTRYLVVDYAATVSGVTPPSSSYFSYPRVKADGVELTAIALGQSSAFSGFKRITFLAPASTVALLEFFGRGQVDNASSAPSGGTFKVTNVSRTNQAPSQTTLRQKPLILPIIGSARATGSMSVVGTAGLGDVMVHTCKDLGDGYTPPMSPWATSSGRTTDSTTCSGFRWTPTMSANVPLAMLRPGPYEVVLRARRTSGTLTPTYTATLGASTLSASRKVTHSALNTWQVFSIGMLNVGDHMPNTTATTALSVSTDIAATDFDEVWLFWAGDDASRTRIAAGSYTRVWLDTPSLANPKRSVWVGSAADRSDAVSGFSLLSSWGRHDLDPNGMCQFVVTTDCLDAITQATYYPAGHTHNAYVPET